MILEVRQVRNRIAFDLPGDARDRASAEPNAKVFLKRETADRRVLVEIAECVYGGYLKAGTRGGLGRGTCGYSDDEDMMRHTLMIE